LKGNYEVKLLGKTVAQVMLQIPSDIVLRLLVIFLIIVATWLISIILSSFVSRTFGRKNPDVARQTKRVVIWTTWLIGILLALGQLGLELTWLLAGVTIAAIVVIVASRDYLSNLAARETIHLYRKFKIGDWIQVGKIFGRVVDITWNDTVLSTPNNEVVYIPNSIIIRSMVINRTTQEGIRISVPLTIDNSVSFDEVEIALLRIGLELKEELVSESKPEVRLVGIYANTTKLELLLRINNPAKSRLVSSEVLKRIKKSLQEKPR
jgi:small conductance mechanosensitive channel